MSDEPTLGELGRTVTAIRADVRDDLHAFAARLDQLVLRDVYLVDQQAVRDRINRLEQDVKDLRAELDLANERARAQRETDRESREADRRVSRGAAWSGAVGLVVAVVMLILTLALRSKGAP